MANKKNRIIPVSDKRGAMQVMKRILNHFRTQVDEELRPRGVTTSQLQILHAIKNSPGSSGAQLARVCYVTPQTVQALIEKIEEEGWIVRHKDKGNDRILAASLTDAGEELLTLAEEAVKRLETRLWDGISAEEIASLKRVLDRCFENIAAE
ncbi:MarR family transcriptional regulator [Granulicella sp. dw_53]|uniref:MarR family winged helix-turn-helix transcriptional regulator n=1 Tax=Granulicella sp. dw_53 TaxID=2719792 RepID=UPI001BD4266D|nr:MarR family transcriptional regulator [Granulicella sp. dw_53]